MEASDVSGRKAGDFRGDGRAPESEPEGIGCPVGGKPYYTGREN